MLRCNGEDTKTIPTGAYFGCESRLTSFASSITREPGQLTQASDADMSVAEKLTGATRDRTPHWHSINWMKVKRTVRRLQARIVKAVQSGKWHKVKALVYLLTHSFAGRALAILRVVCNAGAQTPGVDGQTWSTPEDKSNALASLRRHGYRPQPLRRVYIAKSNGKRRGLGIPTLGDRAMQALYLLGLDPIAEQRADNHSYGFRLERSGADALEQCHNVLGSEHCASWILEADIKACFDRISHEWLLKHVPMDRTVLSMWLKAGFIEKKTWFATSEGTPQGGILSPCLANWTLDGLQTLLAERFMNTPKQARSNKVHLVRYADDFIITGTSQVLLQYGVKPLVEQFLTERGLELSHEKTKITRIEDGFDFLGQTIRRYRDGKVLLKPSRCSVRTFLTKIRETLDKAGSLTSAALIRRLNQQIKGWTMYHRWASSKRTFTQVDRRIFAMIWKWLRHRHRHKSGKWIKQKYFRCKGDRNWVFTGASKDSKGRKYVLYLMEAAKVAVKRYIKVRSDVNPYDPEWEMYLEARTEWKLEQTLAGRKRIGYLWRRQEGKCRSCGEALKESDKPWHIHHVIWKSRGGGDHVGNLELLHGNCHRQIHSQNAKQTERAASCEGR